MTETATNSGLLPLDALNRTLAGLRRHERTLWLAAAGFQVLFLLAMTASRTTTLVTGETVLLKVVPVDPRDLLRGEYVILSYDFTNTPVHAVTGVPPHANASDWRGRTVFIPLRQSDDGQHWVSEQATLREPSLHPYLRGTIVGPARIECGIESYFVQEGQGRKYEEAIRRGDVYAQIAVTPNGTAALKGLVIE